LALNDDETQEEQQPHQQQQPQQLDIEVNQSATEKLAMEKPVMENPVMENPVMEVVTKPKQPDIKMETEDFKLNLDIYDADLESRSPTKPASPVKKKADLKKGESVSKSPRTVRASLDSNNNKAKSDSKSRERPCIFTEFSKRSMEEKRTLWLR
jgi:hypothetical protein